MMKPADTKQTFSKMEAGTARRLIHKHSMKTADTKQTFSKLGAGTARHCPPHIQYEYICIFSGV